jgi:hypothetical protein
MVREKRINSLFKQLTEKWNGYFLTAIKFGKLLTVDVGLLNLNLRCQVMAVCDTLVMRASSPFSKIV